MIFVTVGAQMAFDRLVRTVDAWATMTRAARTLAANSGGSRNGVHAACRGW